MYRLDLSDTTTLQKNGMKPRLRCLSVTGDTEGTCPKYFLQRWLTSVEAGYHGRNKLGAHLPSWLWFKCLQISFIILRWAEWLLFKTYVIAIYTIANSRYLIFILVKLCHSDQSHNDISVYFIQIAINVYTYTTLQKNRYLANYHLVTLILQTLNYS